MRTTLGLHPIAPLNKQLPFQRQAAQVNLPVIAHHAGDPALGFTDHGTKRHWLVAARHGQQGTHANTGIEAGAHQRAFGRHHAADVIFDVGVVTHGVGIQRHAVIAVDGGIRHHRVASPVGFHPGLVFHADARCSRRFNQDVGIPQRLAEGDTVGMAYHPTGELPVEIVLIARVVVAHTQRAVGRLPVRAGATA